MSDVPAPVIAAGLDQVAPPLRAWTQEAPLGGIMTYEEGAITGPVEIELRSEQDLLVYVHVRYEGAQDWYEVEGSPLGARAGLAREIKRLFASDPGIDADGNALSVDVIDVLAGADDAAKLMAQGLDLDEEQ